MNNDIAPKITTCAVAVLKINTPFPDLLLHLAWSFDEIDRYHSVFSNLFPKALYYFVRKNKKYDNNVIKTLIKDSIIRNMIISYFPKHLHSQVLVYTHSLCGVVLSSRDSRKILRRLHSSTAKELESVTADQDVELQGCGPTVDWFFGEQTFEALNDITTTINQKVPNVEDQISMLETLVSASQGVTSAFSGLNNSLETILSKIPTFTEKTAEFKNDYKSTIDKASYFLKLVSLGGVAYASYCLTQRTNVKNVAMLLAAVAFAIYQIGWDEIQSYFTEMGKSLVALVLSALAKVKSNPSVDLQSNVPDMFYLSAIFDGLPKGAINKLTTLMRLAKDLPSFLEGFLDLIKTLLDKATNHYFGFETKEALFKATDHLNAKFEVIMKQSDEGTLAITFENAVNIQFLLKEYELLFKSLDSKQKQNLSRLVESKIHVLTKLQKHFNKFIVINEGFRQEPVSVMFKGPPGIYKSELTSQLADIVLNMCLSREEINNSKREHLIYGRNCSEQFWSRWKNTVKVIIMDDYGQERSVPGETNSCYIDTIKIQNTAPNQLPMAGVDEKGGAFTTNSFTLGNTNLEEFKPYALNSPEAIARRWDFLVTPIPLPEYASKEDPRKIDPNTILTNQDGVLDISLDKYTFEIIPKGNKALTYHATYLQFINEIKKMFQIKTARFKHNCDRRQKLVDALPEVFAKAAREEQDTAMFERLAHARVPSTVPNAAVESFLQSSVQMEPMDSLEEDEDMGFEPTSDFDMYFNPVFQEEEAQEVTMPSLAPDYGFCFRTLLEAPSIEVRISNLKDAIRIVTQGKSLKCKPSYFERWESLTTKPIADILRKSVEEKILLFASLYYHLCEMVYGRFDRPHLPMMFQGMDPFVFFVCLISKDVMYGEWFYRKYTFSVVELEGIDVTIRMDKPTIDAMKDYAKYSFTKLIQWRLKQSTFVGFVFDFTVSYAFFTALAKTVQGGVALLRMIKNFVIDKIFGTEESQSVSPRHQKVVTMKARLDNAQHAQKSVELQMNDTAGRDLVKKINRDNTNKFTVQSPGMPDSESMFYGDVVWLDSSTFVCPEHFATRMRVLSDDVLANSKVYILDDEYHIITEIPALDFIDDGYISKEGDSHLLWYRLPKPLALRKRDITSYFIRDSDLHALSNEDLDIIMKVNSDDGALRTSSARITQYHNAALNLRIAKVLNYKIDTGNGDCGSPILLRKKRLGKRRIAGIHVAGTYKGHNSRDAWCSILTQEALVEAYKHLDVAGVDDELVELQGAAMSMKHSPYKTNKIIPSVIQETSFPSPTKFPAMLTPRNGIDPYAKAIAHYSVRRPLTYNEDNLKLATDDLVSYWCSFPWHLDSELLTVEQALWGDPSNAYYNAIPSSSSVGYPFKFTDPYYKQRLLGDGVARDSTNAFFPEFHRRIWFLIEQANAGVRMNYYYTDNLKMGLVSATKAKEGDTRAFSGSCFELCTVTKCLYGKLVEFTMVQSIEKGMAASVNVYSSDWKNLAMHLAQFSPNFEETKVLPIDYSKFDASHTQIMLSNCLDIMNRWFAYHGFTAYEKARKTIYLEVTHSKHVVFTDIVEWDQGLPSGSFLTLLINSVINLTNVRYCYYELTPDRFNIIPFHKVMYAIVQGDDLGLSCDDRIAEFMTADGIEQAMLSLGYVVTSDVKNEAIRFKPLSETTFLKRGFVVQNGEVLCPLSLDTIMNTPCWSKNDQYFNKITLDAIKFFFREASLHDSTTCEYLFNIMRNAVKEACISGVDGLMNSQEQWRRHVLESEPFVFEL